MRKYIDFCQRCTLKLNTGSVFWGRLPQRQNTILTRNVKNCWADDDEIGAATALSILTFPFITKLKSSLKIFKPHSQNVLYVIARVSATLSSGPILMAGSMICPRWAWTSAASSAKLTDHLSSHDIISAICVFPPWLHIVTLTEGAPPAQISVSCHTAL